MRADALTTGVPARAFFLCFYTHSFDKILSDSVFSLPLAPLLATAQVKSGETQEEEGNSGEVGNTGMQTGFCRVLVASRAHRLLGSVVNQAFYMIKPLWIIVLRLQGY